MHDVCDGYEVDGYKSAVEDWMVAQARYLPFEARPRWAIMRCGGYFQHSIRTV